MELTLAQKQELLQEGFVHIPGVVPRILVDRALRAINHGVGQGMNVSDMQRFRAQSYCPEVSPTAAITDLYNKTPASVLAESLIGGGQVLPVGAGQIALRFPSLAEPTKPGGPHIDGIYTPENGVPFGEIHNFTALLAVFLSDVTAPFSGNFTVWPKSHLQHEAYFRENGPEALLNGMPKVDRGEPHQVIAKAGDICIAHYLLAHSVAPNASPNIRYAIFFRLKSAQHDAQNRESMKDAWMHWPGMTALKNETAAEGVPR